MSAWTCCRCGQPIVDEPHSDPAPEFDGQDCHEACCRYCHPELRTPDEADLPSVDDERDAMRQRRGGLDPEARILGHGHLDREQTARAEAARWIRP